MKRFSIFVISIFFIFSFLNSQEKGNVSKDLLTKIKSAGDSKTFKNADAIIIDDNVSIIAVNLAEFFNGLSQIQLIKLSYIDTGEK